MPVLRPDAKSPAPRAPAERNTLAPSNRRFEGLPQLAKTLRGEVTLSKGAKGDAVEAVQKALVDMGFALGGGPDGDFGPQTQKAIKNFQIHAASKFKDVKPNGTLDAATLRALDKLAPPPGAKGEKGLPQISTYDGKQLKALVVKSEHRTFLFNGKGEITDIFPNAVGAPGSSTDNGLKKVTGKLDERGAQSLGKQLWGDGTVFGTRLIDLSWENGSRSGEELHGTNAPNRLGEDVSHGCIRHDNKDIVKLYETLKVGDRVAVVDWLSDPHLQQQPKKKAPDGVA